MPPAYRPRRPSSCTVVCSPGLPISSAIEAPLQRRGRGVRVVVPPSGDELDVRGPVAERLVLDRRADPIELRAVDVPEPDDVARAEEPVAVMEVGQPPARVEERRRAHPEQLIP